MPPRVANTSSKLAIGMLIVALAFILFQLTKYGQGFFCFSDGPRNETEASEMFREFFEAKSAKSLRMIANMKELGLDEKDEADLRAGCKRCIIAYDGPDRDSDPGWRVSFTFKDQEPYLYRTFVFQVACASNVWVVDSYSWDDPAKPKP